MTVNLEQRATLQLRTGGPEFKYFETGEAALTAAGWAIHLGVAVPEKIALEDGTEIGPDRIRDEYERMLRRKDFG